MTGLHQAFDPVGKKLLVGTATDRFFWQGYDFDTDRDWEVLHLTALGGTGPLNTGPSPVMPITGPLGGAAAASTPYLQIDMGTAVDVATVLLCRDPETGGPLVVRPPVELRAAVTLSQRLAENNVFLGFFECDAATGALRRGTRFADLPTFLNFSNMCAMRLDGTVATQATPIVRVAEAGPFNAGATTFAGFTSTPGGSGPNWTFGDEIVVNFERQGLLFRTADVNTPTVVPTLVRRNDAIPDPTAAYRVGIVLLNPSGPAPTSGTLARIHMLNVLDSIRLDMSPRLTARDTMSAFPVQIVDQAGFRIDSVAPGIFTDTTTPLAAGATFTGAGRDQGATATFSYYAVNVAADAAGTVRIEKSTEAVPTTWRRASEDIPLAAGGIVDRRIPATARHHRVVVVNGGVAQGFLSVTSAYLRT